MSRFPRGHASASLESLERRALLSAAPAVAQLDVGQIADQQPEQFGTLGSQTLFSTYDPQRGQVLWSTDGTHEITALDTSGNPGNWASFSGTYPDNSLVVGNTYFFTGLDQAHGRELWKSDGTAAGTQLVADLVPGAGDSDPQGFVQMNGILYFGAAGELWRSDGTTAGTTAIFDESPFGSDVTQNIAVLGNKLLFTSYVNGQNTGQLWVSDGTAAGTTMLTSFTPTGGGDPAVMGLTTFDGAVYFSADGGKAGYQLWKTDGTTAGTQQVTDIPSTTNNPAFPGLFPTDLEVAGNTLYFQAAGSPSGLWTSDGTATGTVPAAGDATGTILAINSDGSYYQELDLGDTVQIGSAMYDDYEIDLVAANGTRQTMATFDNSMGVENGTVIAANGSIDFVVTTAADGSQLWQSDGTAAGTSLISGIAPTVSDPDPRPVALVGQTLLVSPQGPDPTGDNPTRQLWAVDFGGEATPPAAPAPPPMPAVAVKGHVDAGTFYTASTAPSLSGSAADGDVVSLLVDGQINGTADVVNGKYVVSCASALSSGVHTMAVVVSSGGMTSDPSPQVKVNVQTAKPTVHFLGLKHETMSWQFSESMIHAAAHASVKLVLLEGKKDVHVSADYVLKYDATDGIAKLTLPTGKHALPAGSYRLLLSKTVITSLAGTRLDGKAEFSFAIAAPPKSKK